MLFSAPLALAFACAPVQAEDTGADGTHTSANGIDIVPFSQLLGIARERIGQRKLLDAALSMQDERAVMELFFIGDNGRISSVMLDAQTAAVIDGPVDAASKDIADKNAPKEPDKNDRNGDRRKNEKDGDPDRNPGPNGNGQGNGSDGKDDGKGGGARDGKGGGGKGGRR